MYQTPQRARQQKLQISKNLIPKNSTSTRISIFDALKLLPIRCTAIILTIILITTRIGVETRASIPTTRAPSTKTTLTTLTTTTTTTLRFRYSRSSTSKRKAALRALLQRIDSTYKHAKTASRQSKKVVTSTIKQAYAIRYVGYVPRVYRVARLVRRIARGLQYDQKRRVRRKVVLSL